MIIINMFIYLTGFLATLILLHFINKTIFIPKMPLLIAIIISLFSWISFISIIAIILVVSVITIFIYIINYLLWLIGYDKLNKKFKGE